MRPSSNLAKATAFLLRRCRCGFAVSLVVILEVMRKRQCERIRASPEVFQLQFGNCRDIVTANRKQFDGGMRSRHFDSRQSHEQVTEGLALKPRADRSKASHRGRNYEVGAANFKCDFPSCSVYL
jgi:hypothetical protein